MVSCVDQNTYSLRGLSTDEKPIAFIGNGSTFFEIDTSKVFMFNGENKSWVEINPIGIGFIAL